MKVFVSCLWMIISVPVFAQQVQFDWIVRKDLPIKVFHFLAPTSELGRVGETGEYSESLRLPILRLIDKNGVELGPNSSVVTYLVIENLSDQKVTFSVAPHSYDPLQASVTHNFVCLCNGHRYSIQPKKKWYRIMSLTSAGKVLPRNLRLQHTIFSAPSKK